MTATIHKFPFKHRPQVVDECFYKLTVNLYECSKVFLDGGDEVSAMYCARMAEWGKMIADRMARK